MGIKRVWRYFMHRLSRMRVTPHKLALGFAAGAFVSFTPFIGLHFILAAVVAAVVRGNLIASAIGTLVGNPLTFPFMWIASYNLGARFLGEPARDSLNLQLTDANASIWGDGPLEFLRVLWHSIEPVIYPTLLGGLPLGLLCGAASYFLVRTTLQQFRARRALRRSSVENRQVT